jgi:hypothetical protein
MLKWDVCRVLRDVIPPTPPGPEGSNGNGPLRAQWVARYIFVARRFPLLDPSCRQSRLLRLSVAEVRLDNGGFTLWSDRAVILVENSGVV